MDKTAPTDPKGLIRESYRIAGISPGECRSIFMDWALSVPMDSDHPELIRALLATYAPDAPDHPMTLVLHEGLTTPARARRRGGRAGRLASD